MHAYPAIPSITEAGPALLEEGHLWLLELVDGEPLRFQLQPSGLIRFGDATREFDDPTDMPRRYQHALSHVRDRLDRDRLRSALDDPTTVTFSGTATQLQSIQYRWPEVPSFLGLDVWSAERDTFYPPDVVHQIFDAIGLTPLSPIEREVHPRDFDVSSYTPPDSRWYDGPVAGVLIWNKRGERAVHEGAREDEVVGYADLPHTEAALVDLVTSPAWLQSVIADMQVGRREISTEALIDRCMSALWRGYHPVFTDAPAPVDERAIRAALARALPERVEDVRAEETS